jgi:hypothetical protein
MKFRIQRAAVGKVLEEYTWAYHVEHLICK